MEPKRAYAHSRGQAGPPGTAAAVSPAPSAGRLDALDCRGAQGLCLAALQPLISRWQDAVELADDYYGVYNFNWGYYLESLRLLCVTGTGKPFQAGSGRYGEG